MGLGDFGLDAKIAVPALVEFLKATNVNRPYESYSRSLAADALKAIDPETAAKAGVK